MIGIAITRETIRHSERRRAEQREHEDRDDHHDDEEVRAAADVLLRVPIDRARARAPRRARTRRSSCARRRDTRTPGGCPSSCRSARGRRRRAPTRKTPSPISVRMPGAARAVLEPREERRRPDDEDADEQRQRQHDRQDDLSRGQPLLFLQRLVGRDHQRPHADRERLAEHDDPAEERLPQERVRAGRSSRSRATRRGPCSSGLRTAIAQNPAPRIITPSTTAWPP